MSQEASEELKDALRKTIDMLERDNEKLKIALQNADNVLDDDSDTGDHFDEELHLMEAINGLSFRNIAQNAEENTMKRISADAYSGNIESSLIIRKKEEGLQVEQIIINMEETSPLAEIQQGLCSLLEDINVYGIFTAISSFSRASKVRTSITDMLRHSYSDNFGIETVAKDNPDSSIEFKVTLISAFIYGKKRVNYFEVIWHINWNNDRKYIEHQFSVKQHQGLSKKPELRPLLENLHERNFTEDDHRTLINIWGAIAGLVAT